MRLYYKLALYDIIEHRICLQAPTPPATSVRPAVKREEVTENEEFRQKDTEKRLEAREIRQIHLDQI